MKETTSCYPRTSSTAGCTGAAGSGARIDKSKCAGGNGPRPRIMSDAFSAIINTAAEVLAEGRAGMIEATAIRRLSRPWTRK